MAVTVTAVTKILKSLDIQFFLSKVVILTSPPLKTGPYKIESQGAYKKLKYSSQILKV
jgi:hypothetical protein